MKPAHYIVFHEHVEPRGACRIPASITCSQNEENFDVVLLMGNRRHWRKCWFYGKRDVVCTSM